MFVAGSLHLPQVVLTPGMVGNFEDSLHEICKNMDIIDSSVSFVSFEQVDFGPIIFYR